MPKPQFNKKEFRTREEFMSFMKNETKYIIDLVDNGQYLLKLWVHATGEILDCNAEAHLWKGMFVFEPGRIRPKEKLYLYLTETDKAATELKFKVAAININTYCNV